ncbi:hypothetical protein KDA_42900 [Dictyobacter alpinus]|uniref:Uncharacterized protein n=2 Tax=Dictyobacter alpinus TaxID=2014873 RepID=A0A402BBW2_9CHLR|nr:hypothetical protein KDA_42900 [Dictyobacter alpinus]
MTDSNAARQQVERWVQRLEEQAYSLLLDIDIEELSQKERLNFALKIISQIQHFLTLRQKLDTPDVPTNNVQIMLQNLTRQMRGEAPVEALDGGRVVVEEEGGEGDDGPRR